MDEHKHEWRFAPNIEQVSPARTNTYGFYCTISGCDEYILLPEVERRLLATEQLSRGIAEHAASLVRSEYSGCGPLTGDWVRTEKELLGYARVLGIDNG